MLSGKFFLSESMIVVSDDGLVYNGHHRIEAAAGLPDGVGFYAVVCKGFPKESLPMMDQGFTRRLWHALQMLGIESADHHLSALLQALRDGITVKGKKLRVEECEQLLEQYGDAIYFALPLRKRLRSNGGKGIGRISIAAILARAYYHEPHDMLMRFVEILRGDPSDRHESAAACLREQLLTSGRDSDPIRLYGLIQSSLYAFCRRQERRFVRPIVDRELYILPDETEKTETSPHQAGV